jgi:hypothetical protein
VIASGYAFLPGRQPFGQHWLVGGNTFMLNILKNNAEELGVTASADNFNTVIQRTLDQLHNETATIEIEEGEIDGDTARYTVNITNLAGHKLPSGYPARRVYLEFEMLDEDGNTIFHSGKPQPGQPFEVYGNDLPYEPHHDLITAEDQVQIYEMVMGDVNGNPTTVLERAATMLKDNRLVPLGFSTMHSAYDTTKIVGAALLDPNFNHITVRAKLHFQAVPPRWVEEMFAIDNDIINAMEDMYWEQGPSPVEMVSDEVSSIVVGTNELYNKFSIGPNPAPNGQVTINGGKETIKNISVYDIKGKLVLTRKTNTIRTQVELPDAVGTYLIVVETNAGRHVEKVLRR